MQQIEDELETLNAKVAVVTFEVNVVVENYVRQSEMSWPVLIDSERDLYHAYGMDRGKWWDLAGPKTILAYFKLFAKGRTLKKATGDVKQLGGDVIVDPEGIVRMHFVGQGPSDRPSIEEMTAVIRG